MMLDKILIKEIINPIIYVLLGIVFYNIISMLLKKSYKYTSAHESKKRKTIISLVNNIIKYVIALIVILMTLEVYGVNTSAILASLGVVGLVVGLALQDLIKDFIAGAFIIFDNQYNVGDIVTINGFKGEVVSLGLKSSKVKSFKGDILCISNGQINEVINHSLANNMAIIEVDVAYEEDLDHVLDVLNDLAKELSSSLENLKGEIKVLGVTDLGSSGITIRLTVDTVSGEQFDVERKIRKEIKDRFDKEKINIPYPQLVIHNGK